jgi:hypothetical protein
METCGIPANCRYGVAVHRGVAKSNTAPTPITPVTTSPQENPCPCYTLGTDAQPSPIPPVLTPVYKSGISRGIYRTIKHSPPHLLLSARFLLPPPSLPLDLPATTVRCEDANCTSQVICSIKPVVTPFMTPASPLVPSPPHYHTYILNRTIHHHFILINTPTALRPVPFSR